MVINESTITIHHGVYGTPSVEGAVFAGCPYDPTHTSGMSMSDIVLQGASSIAYNQAVVGAVATSSLKTTTMVTQTVPGSWQQSELTIHGAVPHGEEVLTPLSASGTGNREGPRGPGSAARTARGLVLTAAGAESAGAPAAGLAIQPQPPRHGSAANRSIVYLAARGRLAQG